MAFTSRHEFYNPKSNEVSKLIKQNEVVVFFKGSNGTYSFN